MIASTMDIAHVSPSPAGPGADSAFVPFTEIAGDPACGYLIVCDHARNGLPAEYGDLGLGPESFRRHIAFDPGAAAVSAALAARLGAPAAMSTFSRLLIDPNRGEEDPTLIMRISDGAIIPGNRNVDAAERQRRIDRFHRPYHDAVDRAIDRAIATGHVPAIVSIHSYTPVWRGKPRPWHAGILWDRDERMVEPLLTGLRERTGLVIGDNEPYAGSLANDSMNRHATGRGLAHALIEIRQDLIADEEGAQRWADWLADILEPLNARPELHDIRLPPGAVQLV